MVNTPLIETVFMAVVVTVVVAVVISVSVIVVVLLVVTVVVVVVVMVDFQVDCVCVTRRVCHNHPNLITFRGSPTQRAIVKLFSNSNSLIFPTWNSNGKITQGY